MLNKVRSTIEKYNMLNRGDTVVIGVSGGADSVCLADVMNRLKKEYALNIVLVHINHRLRGEEADRDEAYVRSLGEKYGNEVKVFGFNVRDIARKKGITLEEAGRMLRYEAFYKVAGDLGKIAVAHNINDNCETMLMRLFRGTGVKGLGGINPVRDNIIRPLIAVNKRDIEEYCSINNIKYYEDRTNNEDIYTRNKIRLNLIPYIEKEFNPNISAAMYRTAQMIRAEDGFLDNMALEAYKECEVSKGRIAVDRLIKYDPVIQRRIIRLGFRSFSADLHDISYDHVERVLSLVNKESGRVIELPKGLRAIREQANLYFCRYEENKPFSYEIEINNLKYYKELNGYFLLSDKKIKKNENLYYTTSFDCDKIILPLVLRSRMPNDKIYIAGIGGSKSVKKLFIDSKIPGVLRNSIPLLAMGNEVLWIKDMKTSDKYKADNTVTNPLYMYVFTGGNQQ